MILQELQPFNYKITEKKRRPGVLLTLKGTLQKADTKNANKRVYPRKVWQDVLANKDVQERLNTKRMVGQLDHPVGGITDPEKVSHVITSQELLSDGTVSGTVDVLDTPSGRIASTLFEAGVQLGVSSRGDGSVEDKGDFFEVQDDYKLETYDIVLKPSTPGAFPRIVESEEKAKENVGIIIDSVSTLINNTNDLDVLLECYKIISSINEHKTKRDNVLGNLKNKLKETNEVKETKIKNLEEGSMSNEKETKIVENKIELSAEMKDYMKNWVDKGIQEAVIEKDNQINKLNEQVVNLTDQLDENSKQLDAAKAIIDEFTRKVKDITSNQQIDEQLSEKHDAATQLLEEAVGRLQELSGVKERLEAAEALLEASLEMSQSQAIEGYVDAKIEELNLGEKEEENIRNIIGICENVEEVDHKFESISSFLVNKPNFNREPLPGSQVNNTSSNNDNGKQLNESVQQDALTRMMLDRLSGSNIQ
jgi:predicted HicB family RNase H-like nuclease